MVDRRADTISNPPSRQRDSESPKSRTLAFLMALIFGYTGLHRFYVGKFWTGLAMFLTGGGFGIWWFIDVVLIGTGRFKDDEGRIVGSVESSERQLPRGRAAETGPRGTDGAVGTDHAPGQTEDKLRVETDDGEEVELDEEEVMGDPLEKEFEELEQSYESNSQE